MGGLLVQDIDNSTEETESWISVTKKKPNNQIFWKLSWSF